VSVHLNRAQFLRLGLGLALTTLGLARAQPRRSLELVQWSDIHWGSDRQDPAAWKEALARGLAQNPQGYLFTGDNGDNGKGTGDFAERVRGFWQLTLETLPEKPLMLTLGNSDFRHNYQTDPDNLEETRRLYQQLLGSRYYLDELGNGLHPDHLGSIHWISLNTQIFSPKNRYTGATAQAQRSLEWLSRTLREAPGPAALLLHIPPIYDLFSNALAWRPEWIRALRSVLDEHPGAVCMVGGHFHRNEIHGFSNETPLMVGSSLSRKYDYSPNWRMHRWELAEDRFCSFHSRLFYPGHPQWQKDYAWEKLDKIYNELQREDYLNSYVQDLFARLESAIADPKQYQEEILQHFWSEADLTSFVS